MAKQGFRSNGDTPYVYQEAGGSSIAFGLDSSDSNKFKAVTAPSTNILPTGSTPNIEIDPSTNGNLSFRPNGSGNIQLISTSHITTTGGVLQAAATTGNVTASQGTDGQLLISSSAGVPIWQNITAGSGITVTNGHNSITIAASGGGGGITTLDGNTGSATGGTVTVETANTTVLFAGSGSTLTQDFQGDVNLNLIVGTKPAVVGTSNTGFGNAAFFNLTSGTNNTAIGASALESITTASNNTALGQSSLAFITTGGGNNTGIGHDTLTDLTTGLGNTALGSLAGNNYVGTESNNICIGYHTLGVAAENNTLHIGDSTGTGTGQLKAAFISGIDGVNVGSVAKVVTMATGSTNQLGTATIAAGSGITVTPSANTITIAASGGTPVTTIHGNSGSATGSTITITTGAANANGTALFTAAGSTVTQTFSDANNNTGLGLNCLANIGGGAANSTAFGWNTCAVATGDGLCIMGSQACQSLTTGHHNAGFGDANFFSLLTGSWNAGLGTGAGTNYTGAESHNVSINSRTTTVTGESNTLRIGDGTGTGTQQLNKAVICGIQTITVTGTAVLVSASDQLGVAVSSKRFKKDIKDADSDTDFIHSLRPVTFVWDKSSNPGLHDAPDTRQVGLIAEEVASINTDLVGYDKQGNVLNVHYDRLIPMLLNEIQRLEKRITALEERS